MPVDADQAVPAGKLRSVITYLEMTAPPLKMTALPWGSGPPPSPTSPRPDITVDRLATVPIALYRDLYRRVGEPWLWWERLIVDDDALAATLNDPAVEVRLFRSDGDVIGYSELDRRQADDVEIVFFGLVPDAIGRGLGRILFAATLAAAWQAQTRRIWLHTCTEDHPKALGFYRAAGFHPYRTETAIISDPRDTGLLPSNAAPHVPSTVK